MQLEETQITELAKPFVGMLDAISSFYADPHNAEAYREWYKAKYGTSPESEVKV